jgi:hypothetical protein
MILNCPECDAINEREITDTGDYKTECDSCGHLWGIGIGECQIINAPPREEDTLI